MFLRKPQSALPRNTVINKCSGAGAGSAGAGSAGGDVKHTMDGVADNGESGFNCKYNFQSKI